MGQREELPLWAPDENPGSSGIHLARAGHGHNFPEAGVGGGNGSSSNIASASVALIINVIDYLL